MNTIRRTALGRALLGDLLALLLIPHVGKASEVYVVRFQTNIVYSSSTECYRVGWRDHLLFRNTTGQDLTVVALGASNGYTLPGPEPLTIPPRRTRSVLIAPRGQDYGMTNQWAPRGDYVFLVNRLDVPAGITVESRGELWGPEAAPVLPCPTQGPGSVPASLVFGTIPLPVVRALVPAGSEQVHLGVDLGTQRLRANVGIYNDGAAPANAVIELRRACDDFVIERRFTAVAANAVTQITGIGDNPRLSGGTCSSSGATVYSRYIALVMDQPGFSFVTSLAADAPPRVTITSSIVR
jgi:hypothetical protein